MCEGRTNSVLGLQHPYGMHTIRTQKIDSTTLWVAQERARKEWEGRKEEGARKGMNKWQGVTGRGMQEGGRST